MSFEGKAKMEKQKKLAKAQLTQKQSTTAHFIEKDFKHKETVLIGDDVYSLTIAANMTGRCPPTEVLFCIRQCVIVFCIQSIVSVTYLYNYISLDNF